MYLLDTNVISELRKARQGNAAVAVVEWAAAMPLATLFLSVITIMELELGVLLAHRRDPASSAMLRNWVDNSVLSSFAGRILSIDTAVAQQCAALHVPDPQPERDALIASTAMVHGMTVVTRNVADFDRPGFNRPGLNRSGFNRPGLRVLNPWVAQ